MGKDNLKKETANGTDTAIYEISVKKRRNIQDCKFWKPRGKKTHYCSIDNNDQLKQCYVVCKQFCSRDGNLPNISIIPIHSPNT